MNRASNLRIAPARLWASLIDMAAIGATAKGGVRRLALTDEDAASRALFIDWCHAAGCATRVDAMGTIWARREGVEPDAAAIVIGSHLDTQPTGGKFDGALGVLAALEVVRTLEDAGVRTRRPIEIANFTNEEGARFAPAMLASGVTAGVHTLDFALHRTDAAGVTFGAELARIKAAGEAAAPAIHAFFELHIEQGPVLEAEGLAIGVVAQAQAQRWGEISLTGAEAHAGATAMGRRRDALLAAARIILAVNAIALGEAPAGVGTCGMVESRPQSRNVIPGEAFVTYEFRHPDEAIVARMDAALGVAVAEIAAASGVACAMRAVFACPPTIFDAGCVAMVRRAADACGYSHRTMVSGAGHDACNISRIAPAAMIFIPCVDGVSHNEAEAITSDWAQAGTDVLLHAVLEAAEVA